MTKSKVSINRVKVRVSVKVMAMVRLAGITLSRVDPGTCRSVIYRYHYMSRHSSQYFSKLECSLSSDMAQMSHFCRQWLLKPSATKTRSSVLHLHNTSATRELSVSLDGQLVGCMAQLVERRSLTGELSLSCARPAADG